MNVKIIPLKQLLEHEGGQEILIDTGWFFKGQKVYIGTSGSVSRDIANVKTFIKKLESLVTPLDPWGPL